MLDRLQADLKAAMLSRDTARTSTLRMALAAYRNEAIALGLGPQGVLSEVEVLALLKRLVKQREESIEQYLKGGAPDRAEQERAEVAILKTYLPPMLEGADLEAAVRNAIASCGAQSKKDLGLVMKTLQASHGGTYDGKAASQIAQSLLA